MKERDEGNMSKSEGEESRQSRWRPRQIEQCRWNGCRPDFLSANENARPLARFFSQNYVADRCRAASTPSFPPALPLPPASPRVYNDAHCTDLFFMRHTTRCTPLSYTMGRSDGRPSECLTKSDPRRGREEKGEGGRRFVPSPRRKGDVITSGPQFCAAADIRTR